MPLANISPFSAHTPTGELASKSPTTLVTPIAKRDLLHSRAACAPASTCTKPSDSTAKPIQSLRDGNRMFRARTLVPTTTPGWSSTASANTFGRVASAITVCTPDQAAILAAVNFDDMPPLPRLVPGPPTLTSARPSTSTIFSIRRASGLRFGSSVSTPAASVSKISISALTRFAIKADIRSLSPHLISSSAIASFSFTIGTTPKSSKRSSVAPACRYWLLMRKSSGTRST